MIRLILANFELVKCCLLYFSQVNNYNQMKAGSLFYLPGKNYRWPVKNLQLRHVRPNKKKNPLSASVCRLSIFSDSIYPIATTIDSSLPSHKVYWLSSLALMHFNHSLPVFLDEIGSLPPSQNYGFFTFASTIII